MSDTVRSISALQALFADGGAPKNIVPQKVRDFLVSVITWIAPAFSVLVDGATVTWDTLGYPVSHAKVTLAGNRTLAISNAVAGCSGTLIVIQDATGLRTLALPAGSIAPGGTFALTTTANAKDVLAWVYDGTNYYWTIGKAFS